MQKSLFFPLLQAWLNGREVTQLLEHGDSNVNTLPDVLELESHSQKREEERRHSWASGCSPHSLALSMLYFSATSHRGRARCSRILHSLSPAAALNIPLPSGTLLGHCHLGRQYWLPWGPWRSMGQMQESHSCLPFPGKSPAWALWVSQLVCHLSSHCASEMWGHS